MKKWLEYSIPELFSNRKCHGLVPWLVDKRRGGQSTGLAWTHGGADRGHGGTLTGAWPPAAPVRQSLQAGLQRREGNAGNPVGGSPRRGQRCGGRAMVRKQPREHGLWESGRVSWGGAVKSGVVFTFYGGRGGGGEHRGREFGNSQRQGLKRGGGNSGCKSRLFLGLRRGNGRP
jgi:hypothetical protein